MDNKDKIQGIYKIENTKNHMVYIGQSIDIHNRWKQHKQNLQNNTHHSCKLQNAYNRTKDKSIFEYSIIEIVEYKEDLSKREKYWIDKYNSLYAGYNCADIGNHIIIKDNKAKEKVLKTEYYYELFSNIFDPECMYIGNARQNSKWLERIQNKHYGWIEMKRLCNIIEWYLSYNTNPANILHITLAPHMNGQNAPHVAWINDKDDKILEAYRFGITNHYYIPDYNWYEANKLTDQQEQLFIEIAKNYSTPVFIS